MGQEEAWLQPGCLGTNKAIVGWYVNVAGAVLFKQEVAIVFWKCGDLQAHSLSRRIRVLSHVHVCVFYPGWPLSAWPL